MTQINTTPVSICKSDSVLFGELAIAAGFVGTPIAVCFTESSAALDCALWMHLAQIGGPSRVLHVHGKPDVNEVGKVYGRVAPGDCPRPSSSQPSRLDSADARFRSVATPRDLFKDSADGCR